MKNWLTKDRTSGFTIIEVMIVLAIAGLIMVIVFIAIPQLQRNQRDNARQSIANRVKAEFETYAGNNQGQYPFSSTGTGPGTIADFVSRYITNKVKTEDPSLGTPVMTGDDINEGEPRAWTATADDNITHGQLRIVYGAACSGENLVRSPAGTGTIPQTVRTFAVMIGLDRDGTAYCIDNG